MLARRKRRDEQLFLTEEGDKEMRIKITENDIKKVVKDWLAIKRIFSFYILQGLGCFLGIPDRIAIYKGRIVCIEFKTEKGVQSTFQKLFQANVENSGGIYIVARCLEDVIESFEKLDTIIEEEG